MKRSVIVVGGGISGLTAAWRLRGDAEVTVIEGAPRIGGKLRTGTLAGVPVDEGAESLMALRPEAVLLAEEVGLGDDLCDPAPAPTTLWSHDALRALPPGHVMGIPADPDALTGTGLLSDEGIARLRHEETLPVEAQGEDVSVAEYLAGRFGQEAVDRLVEPLLGGVYAGRPDRLSLRAALPRVAAVAERGEPLLEALRRMRTSPGGAPRADAPRTVPVQGLRGGAGRLPLAVAEAAGARVLTGTRARELQRTVSGRWRVLAVTGDGPLLLEADAVILAVPAYEAAELLRPHAPLADADLGAIQHASTAVVTMAFPRTKALAQGAGHGHARVQALPEGNGFLVPAVEGRTIKAATFLTNKWHWQGESAPDLFLLRTSIGRVAEEHLLAVTDRRLIRTSVDDLHRAVGSIGEPVAARVTRWERGLPQYGVGHVDRVARVREAVGKLPGLALCGAAYEGVGVAACVATGTAAARQLREG
ncbi:protoporphyrinogen oxidase [Streptomyces arenae]|nr:protoporphyrinogen oxidase [Streptomyces arenae]